MDDAGKLKPDAYVHEQKGETRLYTKKTVEKFAEMKKLGRLSELATAPAQQKPAYISISRASRILLLSPNYLRVLEEKGKCIPDAYIETETNGEIRLYYTTTVEHCVAERRRTASIRA